MKTAISIPDPVFEGAERQEKSRSQRYSEADAEYVARHDPATVTDRINEICKDVYSQPDSFVSEAARRILVSSDW